MGVCVREASGIRGGRRLELSLFHGGAIWEGAFEESELMGGRGKEEEFRYSGSHLSPDIIPRGNEEDTSASKLPILQKWPKFRLSSLPL